MNTFEDIREVLAEILDIEPDAIRTDSYLIRDLGAESIDLLELAVALNSRFGIEVDDDAIFLKSLRGLVIEATEQGTAPAEHIARALPFLAPERIGDMVADLDGGPVLKVADLQAYVQWRQGIHA